MDLVAIDVGVSRVRLCRWDGHSLSACVAPRSDPEDSWGSWLSALGVTGTHEVVFRCGDPTIQDRVCREKVIALAGASGGKWVRYLTDSATSDAGLAAARFLANRTRWTTVVSIESDDQGWILGVQDRRGRIEIFERVVGRNPTSLQPPVRLLQLLQGSVNKKISTGDALGMVEDSRPETVGVICIGDRVSEWGSELDAAGLGCAVMIPPRPESWGLVGMMIAPIEMTFSKAIDETAMTIPQLRMAFVELMDAACDAITREGYDLDDAESTRFLRMRGDRKEAEFEGLARSMTAGGNAENQTVSIESIRVYSVVQPPMPEWGLDAAPELRNWPVVNSR